MSILLTDICEFISEEEIIKNFEDYGSLSVIFIPAKYEKQAELPSYNKEKPANHLASAVITYSYTRDAFKAYYKLENICLSKKLFKMSPSFKIKKCIKLKNKRNTIPTFYHAARKRAPCCEYYTNSLINNDNNEIERQSNLKENSLKDVSADDDICRIILNNPTSYTCNDN